MIFLRPAAPQKLHKEFHSQVQLLLGDADVITHDASSTPIWIVGSDNMVWLRNEIDGHRGVSNLSMNRLGGERAGGAGGGPGAGPAASVQPALLARRPVIVRPSWLRSSMAAEAALEASRAPAGVRRQLAAALGTAPQMQEGCMTSVCRSRHSSVLELRAMVQVVAPPRPVRGAMAWPDGLRCVGRKAWSAEGPYYSEQ